MSVFSYRDLCIAYVKGGERERFNPLTGQQYEKLQTHNINEPDEQLQIASSLTIVANRDSYASRRGKPDYYKRGKAGSGWSGRGRSNSPYQRPPKDQNNRQSNLDKGKEKQA